LAEPLDRYDAELTTPDMVILEMDATDKLDAASQLAERMHAAGRISDLAGFLQHVNAREHQLATGLPGGIGLPHARSEFVSRTSIAVGITKYGKALDFGAADGPATVVLLIATPAIRMTSSIVIFLGAGVTAAASVPASGACCSRSRSSLPVGVSGSSVTMANWCGTMCGGKSAAAWARRSATLGTGVPTGTSR